VCRHQRSQSDYQPLRFGDPALRLPTSPSQSVILSRHLQRAHRRRYGRLLGVLSLRSQPRITRDLARPPGRRRSAGARSPLGPGPGVFAAARRNRAAAWPAPPV